MFVNFLVVVGSVFVVSAILVVILAVRAPHVPPCDEVEDSEEINRASGETERTLGINTQSNRVVVVRQGPGPGDHCGELPGQVLAYVNRAVPVTQSLRVISMPIAARSLFQPTKTDPLRALEPDSP